MIVTDFAIGLVALASLVLPGWIVARAARVTQPLLAGYTGSVVAFVALVLAMDALGFRLDLLHCGAAWLTLTVATLLACRGKASHPPERETNPRFSWREHWPLLPALAPAFALVAYRATAQPLFGIDTIFRWNYLAEQLLARGTLGFYPPVTAADYAIYSWPDGLAPAVSVQYFWAYALAGQSRAALTAPLVIFQFILLFIGAQALARRMFSDRAAAFAGALLACSPVVLWSTAMGQETGLTAIALVGLLLYLPDQKNLETTGALVFAGIAAGLGALAREYGVVIPVLGLGLALARRLSGRALLIFFAAAALSALPWYARNWLRTGNPLFNLDLFGWFPVNRTHDWLNQSFQIEFGWAHVPAGATRFVIVNCLASLLAGAAGAWLYFRQARGLLVSAAVFVTLWVASIGYTAAGFTNAIRVLSPAIIVGAVLGGAACARWIPSRRHLAGVGFALAVFSTDAALRALTLPGTVYKIPPGDWLAAGHAVQDYHERPIYRALARAAGSQRILTLGPNALLTSQGAQTLPLWSPEVGFLFDATLPTPEIARRLRAAGIGFVLLNKGAVNERYLARSAFFRDPGPTLRPIWSDDEMVFLQVLDRP